MTTPTTPLLFYTRRLLLHPPLQNRLLNIAHRNLKTPPIRKVRPPPLMTTTPLTYYSKGLIRSQIVKKKQPCRRPSSSSSSSPTTPPPNSSNEKTPSSSTTTPQLSLFQRFKQMYKDYYYVLIPVHLVTSAGWFGSFFYASRSGVDIASYMRKLGISDGLIDKVTASGLGHVAVAYALYKIATPARYAVTLGGTTWSIQKLTRLGYIKPAKEIISKGKEKLRDKLPSKK